MTKYRKPAAFAELVGRMESWMRAEILENPGSSATAVERRARLAGSRIPRSAWRLAWEKLHQQGYRDVGTLHRSRWVPPARRCAQLARDCPPGPRREALLRWAFL